MAGLRARKKELTLRTIQREALRLYTEQGFEATTVEQIAEAAGVSPATFYRYFTSKEDVVITDDYDPIFVSSIMERPADEPLIDSIRAIMTDVLIAHFDRDRELLRTRHALMRKTQSLQAASFQEQERSHEMFIGLIARHLRRSINDLDVRIAVGAITGALKEAFGSWLDDGGKGGVEQLRIVLNHAIDRIESALRF
jgi:AcrR family transcriptional regulator